MSFSAFPQFNRPELAAYARSRQRLPWLLLELFPGPRAEDRLARALVARKAINLKELLESFEFHALVRRRIRRPVMADLFCGHGLTGMLFAVSERTVQRVMLVDKRRPSSFDAIFDAVCEVAPWAREKIEFTECLVEDAEVPEGAGLLAVHACGVRTDATLKLAVELGGPVAVMPCCYRRAARPDSPALMKALGREMALDVERTQALESTRQVEWASVPEVITPMNRVIIGR